MHTMRRILLLLATATAVAVALALSGVLRPEAAHPADPPAKVVTTVGRGTISTVPDVATVSFGVRTEAATAADALARNSDLMARVVAALKAAGGERLQTQEVSLYPRTDETGKTTGFVAQDTVSARSKIAGAGSLVDAAVAAGANTVQGPSLERSDRDAIYRDALAKALGDARAKAEALAKAGGFDVGPVASVDEQVDTGDRPVFESVAAAKASDTAIEPGRQDVDATVTVSFEIR
jgi:hypothetical protein